MGKLKIAMSFVFLTCLFVRADYTISQDTVRSAQVEGSHNNGGHEYAVWNITVPEGAVAHVSVFGTMSSVACSWKSAYLIFTGDSEEHHFGGYVDGKTYSATFEKSSKVTIYANAKPGEYSELVPVVNPITGSVTYTHRYVTYSAYTCTLKYEITVTYKSLAKHTVKYLPGTNGSGAERSQQKTVGVDLELLGAVFSRSGYSQVGWSLRSDGSTLDYSLGETYARDDDLTLYPYWQKGSAAAVPVSLAVNGGASISPGSSLNLTCRVKYTDGSSRLVTPKWLISAGVNNATISSDGVLSVKASATGSVTVKAIFVEGEVFVVNTLKITIKNDSSRIVTAVPSGGGYAVSEDFDTGDTYAWYFDVSKCPNWVTSPMVAIASGTFKGSAYDLTYYWTKPIEEARNKRCNLVDTAHFSIRASENDTAQERSWTVPAKDSLGNVLKTFIFVQKASNAESSFWLSVTGESQVKAGHQSLYICEAFFSNGSATLVQPTWSVSSGNTTASVSSDGVLTVGKVTEKTSVTVSARLSCNGKTETATKTVTILPQESVPASPTDVVASDGMSVDCVRISWVEIVNAKSYDVYRSTSSTRPSSPTMTGVTSPCEDQTAIPGVKYYYWVAAVNSVGSTVSSCDTGYRAVSLSLDETTVSYAASGGNGSVSVSANTVWSVVTDVDWIVLGDSLGGSVLTYTVAACETEQPRVGTIRVTTDLTAAYTETKTITVMQAGVGGSSCVVFCSNGGSGAMVPFVVEKDSVHRLPKCTLTPPDDRTHFAGWACSNGRRYGDEMLVFGLGCVTMTAIWE